jgi:hypothetical protein
MSLAPCPDCGNKCSLLATICPKCGRPFKQGDLKASDPEPTPYKTPEERAAEWAPSWKKGATSPSVNSGAIGGLIAAVLIIVLMILCCSGGRGDSTADCERERLKENQRRYAQAQRDPNYNPEYVEPCK